MKPLFESGRSETFDWNCLSLSDVVQHNGNVKQKKWSLIECSGFAHNVVRVTLCPYPTLPISSTINTQTFEIAFLISGSQSFRCFREGGFSCGRSPFFCRSLPVAAPGLRFPIHPSHGSRTAFKKLNSRSKKIRNSKNNIKILRIIIKNNNIYN
jgi:hypothetical protein